MAVYRFIRSRGGCTCTYVRVGRTQALCAVAIGVFAGYTLLSYWFPSIPQSSKNLGIHEQTYPFVHSFVDFSSVRHQKNQLETNEKRVRDRGIQFDQSGTKFVVEGKEKLILSGAIHYFRVVPAYWEDRLLRLKAAGLNTVETYVPWNLHEPLPGHYDFTGILDVKAYILLAHRLGLHVIVRPGPYICAEWELGGLPAWLLHYHDMQLRTTHSDYLSAIDRYFRHLFDILLPLQSSYGGPIIAFQVENEYSGYPLGFDKLEKEYMTFLFQLLRELGVVELLFTSDNQKYIDESVLLKPAMDILLTINFMNDLGGLSHLKEVQPYKPRMVMELWTGWFDHWNESHLTRNQQPSELAAKMSTMISDGVSMNLYMFHGGTNFGFMNGGSWDRDIHEFYKSQVTSYDYDAPVSECGDITDKYLNIRNVISRLAPKSMSTFPLPPVPENPPKCSYGKITLDQYVSILDTLQYAPEPYTADYPIPMEYLPVNGGWGQGYGFILYRTYISSSVERITIHQLRDFGITIINFKSVKRLSSFPQRQSFQIPLEVNRRGPLALDILVENAGRVNHNVPLEYRKGINGGVEVDGIKHRRWDMYALEFKSSFINIVDSGNMWSVTPPPATLGPSLFKGSFTITGTPCDTFADMSGWGKGILFVNGANLGRYWSVGPQRTLYIPGPVLREGVNKVVVFELHEPKTPQTLIFRDKPILDDYRKLES